MELTKKQDNEVKQSITWLKEAIKFYEQRANTYHLSGLVSEMEYALEQLKPLLKEVQEKQ